jgi:hypothetical protein
VTAAGLAAFDANVTGLAPQVQASFMVLECPVGYYGVGGLVGSTCTKCPCGSTTVTAATADAQCSSKH